MQATLATATKISFEGSCERVTLPAETGQIEILADHTALLTLLASGKVVIREESGTTHEFVISSGFAEVEKNHVRIIAERAEQPADIAVDQSRQHLESLLEKLKIGGLTPDQVASTQREIRFERCRLSAGQA